MLTKKGNQTSTASVMTNYWDNLSKRGGMDGFSDSWQDCLEEEHYQLEKNTVYPDSFTQVYFLYEIGLNISFQT